MVALGQFLLGVAGCVAGILLLAWVGAKVDLWLGGGARRRPGRTMTSGTIEPFNHSTFQPFNRTR